MEIVRNKINFKLNEKERFAIEFTCRVLCDIANAEEEEGTELLQYWTNDDIANCIDLLNDIVKESL